MDLIKAISERHSVRKYTDEPVTAADIEKIVETARHAQSWKNTQTTRYNLVAGRELIDRLADEATHGFIWNQKTMKGAPAVVVQTTIDHISGYEPDGSPSTSKGDHWQSFDAGIAAQCFCLAAHAEGYGTLIMGIFDEDKVKEICGIPENEKVSSLIAIGRPDGEIKGPGRMEASELVRVIG
ncbi:MAG: nitroreductase family protein [Firmicutes bacterium]|nr:nitroreductase family protein [Bacillota bacterium]